MVVRFRKKEDPDKSILYKKHSSFPVRKNYFSGKIPNIFIGSYAYPKVSSGALVDPKGDSIDNPKHIISQGHSIPRILQSRQSLVNSRVRTHVLDTDSRFREQAIDLAKSKREVDSEIFLKKSLSSNALSFSERSLPHGPSGDLRKLLLTSNPSIPRPVERITSDTDVKATTALHELTSKGFDEHYLTRLFSVGTLGQKRKMVPTKWSITAVDDTLSTQLRNEILDYSQKDYQVYTDTYLGNEYVVIIIPGPWSFELFEMALPHCIYNSTDDITVTQDYEFQYGRKTYASQTSGAYYAVRLAVLEHCKREKKQAKVIVFRIITKEYTVPLGVWVVREGIRQALQSKPLDEPIDSTLQAKGVVSKLLSRHTGEKKGFFVKKSVIFSQSQKSLSSWFS
ncbi:MAG: Nre family DNA repair protein [Nanobdellota archaeon]